MRRSTAGYEEAQWIGSLVERGAIPQNAKIMTESRSYALSPLPFAIPECEACGAAPLVDLFRPADVIEQHVTVLAMGYPLQGKIAGDCRVDPIAGPERLRYATRNPFNQTEYQSIAMRVACQASEVNLHGNVVLQ